MIPNIQNTKMKFTEKLSLKSDINQRKLAFTVFLKNWVVFNNYITEKIHVQRFERSLLPMKQIDMHTIPVSCVSRSNQKMTNDVTGFKQILC